MRRPKAAIALLAACAAASCARPSTAPTPADAPVAREMRAIWIATVRNIDWPTKPGLSASEQRAELIDIYDRAVAAGFNAVILQVRPAADAVYRSPLEPWSILLSGNQGDDPGYDPLEFAVREAHARGLELHAWVNPFRAGNAADTARMSPTHVWNARRELVRVYGAQLWLDPGEPAAREHSMQVVRDIVRRYDVDGIHMDDYFYPYPVRDPARQGNLPFPDSASYARSGSTLAIDDWRRANIDDFVERMYRESHAIKPMIKVGISPFGIWRPGNPPSVAGFDAYAQLYADARKWLREGWVDYFTPQLYWAISAPQQSFPALLDWWIAENVKGRHIWPGMATYRAGSGQSNGFALDEIARQIEITRSRPGAPGQVMFNTTTTLKRPAFVATIAPLYAERALVPSYPWLDAEPPVAPAITVAGRTVQLSAAERPRFWLVQAERPGGFLRRAQSVSRIADGASATVTLDFEPRSVSVRAVDLAGNASPAAAWRRP